MRAGCSSSRSEIFRMEPCTVRDAGRAWSDRSGWEWAVHRMADRENRRAHGYDQRRGSDRALQSRDKPRKSTRGVPCHLCGLGSWNNAASFIPRSIVRANAQPAGHVREDPRLGEASKLLTRVLPLGGGTGALLRILLNLNRYGWAARGELGALGVNLESLEDSQG
jgi:hypothetical protein